MSKTYFILFGMLSLAKINLPKGHVSLHPPTPRCTTDCPGVGGCFSPGLGGDPSGDHPPPHQEHAQAL